MCYDIDQQGVHLVALSMGNMSHVDPTGNTVTAVVRLKDCSLMLTSIYLPPNNEHTKLASMYHVANIHALIKCPWAIFGDFNMTPCELVAMDWTIVSRGTIHCADIARTVNQPNGRLIDYAVMDQRTQNMIASRR